MRILEHDGATSTQLQYHPQSKHLPFCVVSIDSQTPTLWCDSIELGSKRFDETVKRMSAKLTLDLDNPPEGLQTANARLPGRVIAKQLNTDKYIIGVKHATRGEDLYLASRDGQSVWTPDEERLTCLKLTTGPVKREGWVNVYEPSGYNGYGIINEGANAIFESKQAAEAFGADRKITATVKVTWEE